MKRHLLAVILFAVTTTCAHATEPNETFGTATILPAGVFSVADSLVAGTSGSFPNTLLANYDLFGDIDQVSDDDGPYEIEGGSALYNVPTNSGLVEFVVSGHPDFGFSGGHSETGYYEINVDAFDLFGDYIGSYTDVLLLEPGMVNDFSLYDDEAYSYDVWTAPAESVISDVDFFTFTGLAAGASFTVETIDTDGINIDTYLGWFDSGGALIEANDDIDYDNDIYQSMLTGTVPAGGALTFAVTGFGDEEFDGSHEIEGAYELLLDVEGTVLAGDYNADGHVDTADWVMWRKGAASGDYATWRTHFGEPISGAGGDSSSSGSVPEPEFLAPFAAWIIIGFAATGRRRVAALS